MYCVLCYVVYSVRNISIFAILGKAKVALSLSKVLRAMLCRYSVRTVSIFVILSVAKNDI